MNPLVSPAWLAGQLHQPGAVILDATLPPVGMTPVVDVHARYLERHLPGAVFFDIEELSDKATSLPHMLSPPQTFAQAMAELGVGDAMTIVVYEQEGVFSAARAWWMLRTFGAAHVYVLDGGLRAWVEAGLPVEAGPVHRKPAQFDARLRPGAVVELPQLLHGLESGGQVLDARSAGRFAGSAPEPRAGLRSGHMPGATNIPFTDLVEHGRLKSAAALQALFRSRHIALEQPITTTCGSGVTAAVLALALEICGAKSVSLYDGSWAEYAQQPEAVIRGPS